MFHPLDTQENLRMLAEMGLIASAGATCNGEYGIFCGPASRDAFLTRLPFRIPQIRPSLYRQTRCTATARMMGISQLLVTETTQMLRRMERRLLFELSRRPEWTSTRAPPTMGK